MVYNDSADHFDWLQPMTGRMMRSDGETVLLAEVIENLVSPFQHLRVTEAQPIIELKSNYGLSYFRDVTTETGGATVTNDGAEYLLDVTGASGDVAELRSAERIRYVPGLSVELGIGIRTDGVAPTGDQIMYWGGIDESFNNGIYFGRDSTGLFVGIASNGTETLKVYQASWNMDTLDGSGGPGQRGGGNPSGIELDTDNGNIFQVVYQWYGYGIIEWSVLVYDTVRKRERKIVVHTTKVNGAVSVRDPNLPVTARVENNTTTSNPLTLYVGGRQGTVLGQYLPNRRLNGEIRINATGIGTTYVPLVSLRRKTAFAGVSVKLGAVGIIASVDMIYKIVSGGSLTGASFGTPSDTTASETAIESDTSATALTGGQIMDRGLVAGSRGGTIASQIDLPQFDFVNSDAVTLMVRTVTGTNANATANLEVREEW